MEAAPVAAAAAAVEPEAEPEGGGWKEEEEADDDADGDSVVKGAGGAIAGVRAAEEGRRCAAREGG